MKTTIVSIINQKGGVGKSTTALALASGLSRRGYKTLTIDLDTQANLSSSIRANPDGATTYDVLIRNIDAREAIQSTPTCDVIPSDIQMVNADLDIVGDGREFRLRDAIRDVSSGYEFVVIDTPPALGILTINALVASTTIVIPSQADTYSMNGVEQLSETVKITREKANPSLLVDGILITRYKGDRSVFASAFVGNTTKVATLMNTRVYNAKIREAIDIQKSQCVQQSIFEYAPNSLVALDYNDFITEFLDNQ